MSSASFQEGDLLFFFPAHWGVRKYDKHRFYKEMSGLGLKGVDFLLLDPAQEGHVYLLEVKNYQTRIREGAVFKAELKPAAKLAKTIVAKYEHTIKAIRAVHLYYNRKWWFRFISKTVGSNRKLKYDLFFWNHLYQLTEEKQHHTLLFWIETEEAQPAYRKKVLELIRKKLPDGVEAQLANQEYPYPPGVRAEKL